MDTRDPLFGSGLSRQAVVCTRCGKAWDERVVDTTHSVDDLGGSLCPSCLLTTSHGDPFPEDPTAKGVERTSEV